MVWRAVQKVSTLVCDAGNRGSINWEDVEWEVGTQQLGEVGGLHTKRYRESFDAFVKGGEAEAKNMFQSGGEPVHCLSTRFEGVNYRVSMLIGMAGLSTKQLVTIYNPSYWNRFTQSVEGESEEEKKSRTDGRWLLSFMQALLHTQRTNGMLVQVAAPQARTRCFEDPALAV